MRPQKSPTWHEVLRGSPNLLKIFEASPGLLRNLCFQWLVEVPCGFPKPSTDTKKNNGLNFLSVRVRSSLRVYFLSFWSCPTALLDTQKSSRRKNHKITTSPRSIWGSLKLSKNLKGRLIISYEFDEVADLLEELWTFYRLPKPI